jgi:CysZ protein
VTGLLGGFRLPFEGARLLWRERRLWGPAAVPFALSLLAFTAVFYLIVSHAGALHAFATAWMPELVATRWFQWIWIGPALLLLKLTGAFLFLALAGACVLAAFLLASLLASPFHDALSRRVEEIEAGVVRDDTGDGLVGALREAGRALREEGRRLSFFLAVVGSLLAMGVLVPGAHLVTGPAATAFTVLFLPLDYASYTLDRRRFSFRDKRRWVFGHGAVMVGFGAAAFLTCMVPLLNFAAMPLLVVGGTLLALRLGGDQAAGSGSTSS